MIVRILEFVLLFLVLYPIGEFIVKQLNLQVLNSNIGKLIIAVLSLSFLAILISFFLPPWKILLPSYIILILYSIYDKLWKIKFHTQRIFALVLFAALFSGVSYVVDEGGYYGQTLSIFRDYGLIKGIANFDLRLGFNSGFHALQSTFFWPNQNIYFSINGFLIMVFFDYLISKIKSNKNTFHLIILLFFPFIILLGTSQSPDVIVFIATVIVIERVLIKKKTLSISEWVVLISLGILIKPTLALAIFPLLLFVKNWKVKLKPFIISIIVLLVFIGKDIYSSGFVFFPSKSAIHTSVKWRMPIEIYKEEIKSIEFGSFEEVFIQKGKMSIKELLLDNKLKSVLLWLIIIIHIALLYSVIRGNISIKVMLTLLFFDVFWLQAPHFRLGMHLFIPIIGLLVNLPKRTYLLVQNMAAPASLLLIFLVLISPEVDLSRIVSNPHYQKLNFFDANNFFVPQKSKEVGLSNELSPSGIKYFQPISGNYCWHNCFPCKMKNSPIKDFESNNVKYSLRLIDNSIENGFIWVKKDKLE